MRRSTKSPFQKITGDSHRLVMLSQGLAQSSSRMEERSWERALSNLLAKLLRTGHQETLDNALDHLYKKDLPAYDALMEAAEEASSSCVIEHEDAQYDALLIAAPVLAWTRYTIASGAIPPDTRTTLAAHLSAHLLAPETHLALAPTLYAIDQLPRTHGETYALTHKLAQAAIKNTPPKPPTSSEETAPFLADTRYLLAVVTARAGEPLFRWQASLDAADRMRALTQWRNQVTPTVMRLLPGCSVELLLPEAYYVACREADRLIRPASIRAAVNYLTTTLGVDPQSLRAVIGAFGEEPVGSRLDEYRIGFTLRHDSEVVYGVVWPLFGQEDDDEGDGSSLSETLGSPEALMENPRSPLEEIQALLRECGIVHIKRHIERFPMEFCDDCGAPLYPDPEGELVHAEMPEDAPSGTEHFH
ncbi:Protein of unknown function [Noviherbaspirillum humi]|uniref:DUF2863 domain-containing protein n=1 Tax=Noviherbaspirillum humi TaxID=1688639 RepID=A0A239FMZ1_9BURK|nr:DUF2863 family protein [Noviherbaspirillum humi]SNS58250.1 Protein of unknown function [Noviherbaspirillum humi]